MPPTPKHHLPLYWQTALRRIGAEPGIGVSAIIALLRPWLLEYRARRKTDSGRARVDLEYARALEQIHLAWRLGILGYPPPAYLDRSRYAPLPSLAYASGTAQRAVLQRRHPSHLRTPLAPCPTPESERKLLT